MIFKATIDQVLQICANAVNASSPCGMGILHFTDQKFEGSDMRHYLRIDGGGMWIGHTVLSR